MLCSDDNDELDTDSVIPEELVLVGVLKFLLESEKMLLEVL